ncbi:MAG: ABC transporter substrate-binding protein [Polyangiales bacterium]
MLGLLAACSRAPAGTGTPPAHGGPRRGGTLNVIAPPEAVAVLGVATTSGFTSRVGSKVTEGLLSYDFDLRPVPVLATAWAISPDGLTYTFELRKGVRWHDGKPFTSADVAFSIATLKTYHPRGRVVFSRVTDIVTPDPYTVTLRLSKPAPYLIKGLSAGESPMIPRHLYEGTDILSNPYNMAPIGTGPFVFKQWARGSHLILDRNPDYWDQPKPYVDRIVMHVISEPSARAAAIESGEIDLAGDTPVPLGDMERFKRLPGLTFTTRGYEYAGNLSQIELNLERKELSNIHVRRALAHAIDVEKLVQLAWFGYGKVASSAVSPSLSAYLDPSIRPYPYNPALSEQLLDAAGYPRTSNGFRFALKIIFNPYYAESNRRASQYLRQALIAIGIDASVAANDFASYVRMQYTARDFDVCMNNLGNAWDPTIGVQRLYASSSFKVGLAFSNGTHYVNPQLDTLLEQSGVETDEAKRKALLFEVQRILYQELPALNVAAYAPVTVAKASVRNHTLRATGLSDSFADVWIDVQHPN